MRAADLDLRELLHFDPRGGVIRFGGERALLFDAVALGLLRRELIDTLGVTAARGVLTRFGYAHGWRTAESLREGFPWDDEGEWRRAGGRLHMLQGLVVVEPVAPRPGPVPPPFAEAHWHDSYEAEQHLLQLGQSDTPVCWTLAGYASGYLSCANGREVVCIETRCRGRGDSACHLVGKHREDWDESVRHELAFYERGSGDAAVTRLTRELKRMEAELQSRRTELSRRARAPVDPSGLVARSGGMARALDLARRVAKSDTTVLLTGESGVGKERFARYIHEESARSAGPFVAVNCGALPETLLESELFGHAQGAFTGAVRDRIGLFEAASGGTLLLDEIGDISPAMQVKLLRVLEERALRRVGETRTRPVHVRVLAATHRDLLSEIRAARFREDLFYRLRVVELRVPPLRERRDDLLPLARELLAEISARMQRPLVGFTPAAAQRILAHPWPGNVRELSNTLERAVLLAEGRRVDAADLGEVGAPAEGVAGVAGALRPLREVEREHLLRALRMTGGHRARAAAALGIGVATLYRKLKEYGAQGADG